jgi:hypothetical protein
MAEQAATMTMAMTMSGLSITKRLIVVFSNEP